MTRDDIIKLAREAGFTEFDLSQGREDILVEFSALVAAAEREACAKLCDDMAADYPEGYPDYAFCLAAEELARLIRARGQA